MKVIAIVVAFMAVLLAAAASLVRLLARRVVGVEPRRKTIEVRRVGDDVALANHRGKINLRGLQRCDASGTSLTAVQGDGE